MTWSEVSEPVLVAAGVDGGVVCLQEIATLKTCNLIYLVLLLSQY